MNMIAAMELKYFYFTLSNNMNIVRAYKPDVDSWKAYTK